MSIGRYRIPGRASAIIAILAIFGPMARANDPVRDLRILRDVTRLRLDHATPIDTHAATVLAHVRVSRPVSDQPNDNQFSYHIAVIVYQVLAGDFKTSRWEFSRPFLIAGSGFDRLGLNAQPYETPGEATAIIRVLPDAGKIKILDTYLIPPEWAADAAAAHEYCRTHADLFRGPPGPDQAMALAGILHGKNAMLAIASARTLALDPANMRAVMTEVDGSTGLRQAGIMLAFLQCMKPTASALQDSMATLAAVIRAAPNTDALHGIALAAFAAGEWGERTADDFLTGLVGQARLDKLSAAERLQPILIRSAREVFIELDPSLRDRYVAFLVGLEGAKCP